MDRRRGFFWTTRGPSQVMLNEWNEGMKGLALGDFPNCIQLFVGLQLMAPGESRRFWIPAELAFGTNQTDPASAWESGALSHLFRYTFLQGNCKANGPTVFWHWALFNWTATKASCRAAWMHVNLNSKSLKNMSLCQFVNMSRLTATSRYQLIPLYLLASGCFSDVIYVRVWKRGRSDRLERSSSLADTRLTEPPKDAAAIWELEVEQKRPDTSSRC